MAYLCSSRLLFWKKMVLAAVCMALPAAIPKDRRGMRCTNPFCDFECVRMENCNMGDMGADIDIDDDIVRCLHACKHGACGNIMHALHALQVIRWLSIHGLSMHGQNCKDSSCSGVMEMVTRSSHGKEIPGLRCSNWRCGSRASARGEFFSLYPLLTEAVMLVYAIARRWTPQHLMAEMLKISSKDRFTDMLNNIGRIATFFTEYLFKHYYGRWELIICDEAATGQAKKSKNRKGTGAKNLWWWMSLCCAVQVAVDKRKTTAFFFEKIKSHLVPSGKKKTRTKEHLSWHVERLAKWQGTVVTDCAKGYLCLGDSVRGDIDHRDNKHSAGFNVPGAKSIAAGAETENSNLNCGGRRAWDPL